VGYKNIDWNSIAKMKLTNSKSYIFSWNVKYPVFNFPMLYRLLFEMKDNIYSTYTQWKGETK